MSLSFVFIAVRYQRRQVLDPDIMSAIIVRVQQKQGDGGLAFVDLGTQICHDEALSVPVVRQTVNCNTRIQRFKFLYLFHRERKCQTGDIHVVFVLNVMTCSMGVTLGRVYRRQPGPNETLVVIILYVDDATL